MQYKEEMTLHYLSFCVADLYDDKNRSGYTEKIFNVIRETMKMILDAYKGRIHTVFFCTTIMETYFYLPSDYNREDVARIKNAVEDFITGWEG